MQFGCTHDEVRLALGLFIFIVRQVHLRFRAKKFNKTLSAWSTKGSGYVGSSEGTCGRWLVDTVVTMIIYYR